LHDLTRYLVVDGKATICRHLLLFQINDGHREGGLSRIHSVVTVCDI
jgi:hypothetical protein